MKTEKLAASQLENIYLKKNNNKPLTGLSLTNYAVSEYFSPRNILQGINDLILLQNNTHYSECSAIPFLWQKLSDLAKAE